MELEHLRVYQDLLLLSEKMFSMLVYMEDQQLEQLE